MTRIILPKGTTHIEFSKLPKMLANAMCPLLPDKSNREEHEVTINICKAGNLKAVRQRELKLYDKTSLLLVDMSHEADMKSALVAIDDLAFTGFHYGFDLIVDGTQELPMFTMQAQPACVPPELKKLRPNANVRFKHLGAEIESGNGTTTAGVLIQNIENTIERQSRGFFTVDETARLLKIPGKEVSVKKALNDILEAHKNQYLIVRDADTHNPIESNIKICIYSSLLKDSEIEKWIKDRGLQYTSPQASQSLNGGESRNTQTVSATRWEPEKLQQLKDYRANHTMPETAKHFGISEQRIRQLLPRNSTKLNGHNVFSHRIK
jgi:hypothetical protein